MGDTFTTSDASSPITALPSYLAAADARTLAASVPSSLAGMAQLLALSDAALATTLALASMDIDRAMRYQGRKYDMSGAQMLEFPRVPYPEDAWQGFQPYPGAAFPPWLQNSAGPFVWDWDSVNEVAIVPQNVQLATLFQAAYLMLPEFADRLEKIRSGLAGQRTGTGQEMYIKAGEAVPGGFTGLCDRSSRIMHFYRIRSGRML